jgi:rhodanese-related sulfurtransferase
MIKQILILTGVSILLAAAVNLIHPAGLPWVEDWGSRVEAQAVREEIALVQLADMLNFLRDSSRLFVDARSAAEYARGHLPGAVSLPFETLEEHPAAVAQILASGKPPVFYCSGPECDDSLLLAIELRKLGRNDGAVFIGGIELWQSELLNTEGEAVQ